MSADLRAKFRVVTPQRVRFAETDSQAIVHNSNYLVYAETGLCEYTRALMIAEGFSAEDPALLRQFSDHFGGNNWVRHAEIDFRSPARADDLIEIGLRVARFGQSSYSSEINIMRDGDLLVALKMTYVWFDMATQKVQPIPQKFIDAVGRFEVTPPEIAR